MDVLTATERNLRMAPTIDARAAWTGDVLECRKLYRQFSSYFRGDFRAICTYYGWTREAMVAALRCGKL